MTVDGKNPAPVERCGKHPIIYRPSTILLVVSQPSTVCYYDGGNRENIMAFLGFSDHMSYILMVK